MLYRRIKASNDQLSILGFGCMRFPEKNGKIDEVKAEALIRYAIEKGVNYFDTAVPYHVGNSEIFLGKVLSKGLREKVKIATKLPPWQVDSYDHMEMIFKTQLSKLKTHYIDYYLVHSLDRQNWDKLLKLNLFNFLDKIKAEKKALNIGFSFHGDLPTFKEIVDAYQWDFCQIQYNYLDEKNQAGKEGLEYADQKGLGIIVMEPLRGGNLAKNVPKEIEAIWDQSDIARTPAEWALRWIWNHPQVTCVLSGMAEMTQLEENIQIASSAYENSLTEKEILLTENARDTYRQLMKIGCTGCRYCLPCPKNIEIPAILEVYNNKYLFKTGFSSRIMYAFRMGVVGNSGFASHCIKCGKCEKACPQGLPIQKGLSEAKKELEGVVTNMLIFLIRIIFNRVKKKMLQEG